MCGVVPIPIPVPVAIPSPSEQCIAEAERANLATQELSIVYEYLPGTYMGMVDTNTSSMGAVYFPSNGPSKRWGDRRAGRCETGASAGGVSSIRSPSRYSLLGSVEVARSPTGRRLISVQGWGKWEERAERKEWNGGRSQAKSAAAKRHGKQAHSFIHSAPPSPPGIEDPLPANWGADMDQGSNLALCTVCGWVWRVWTGRGLGCCIGLWPSRSRRLCNRSHHSLEQGKT